jgi:hypothetical protein
MFHQGKFFCIMETSKEPTMNALQRELSDGKKTAAETDVRITEFGWKCKSNFGIK